MKLGFGRAAVLSISSGLLVSLAFPSWLTPSFHPWTGWLAWVALVPVLIALEGAGPLAGAGLGWLAGFTFFASALYWVQAVQELGAFRHAAWLAFASALAAYWAVWGYAVARAGSHRALWVAPAVWAAAEMLRGVMFTGFPWVPLGASQWACPPFFVSARWIGVTGISLAIVSVNVALWSLYRKKFSFRSPAEVLRRPAVRLAAAWITGLLLLSLGGHWQIRSETKSHGGFAVAALQGNFTEDEKWNLPDGKVLDRYEALAVKASAARPELIVWPETATASVIGSEPGMAERLVALAGRTGASHVVGALFYEPPGRLYNGAFLISGRQIEGGYFKMHLVPFGEYLPRWVAALVPSAKKLTHGLQNLKAGTELMLLHLPNGVTAGVAICYEAVFSWHARRLVGQGAEVLVNITNDSWYGRTAATYQHALGPLARSVECGRYTVRCANTGVSLIIDPYGRFAEPLALFRAGIVEGKIAALQAKTFYAVWGDTAVLGFILFALLAAWRAGAGARTEE